MDIVKQLSRIPLYYKETPAGGKRYLKVIFDESEKSAITFSLCQCKNDPHSSSSPHVHEDSYEVYYTISGKGYVKVAERIFEASPERVVIVPPGELHEAYTEQSAWEYLVIHEKGLNFSKIKEEWREVK